MGSEFLELIYGSLLKLEEEDPVAFKLLKTKKEKMDYAFNQLNDYVTFDYTRASKAKDKDMRIIKSTVIASKKHLREDMESFSIEENT